MAGNTDPRARVAWIDSAKAIAVLSVILLHAAHWVSEAGSTSSAVTWTMARLLVPLPIFFLLSGVLAGRGVARGGASGGDVVRRILPLLWVYLVWQPAIVAYRVIGSTAISGEPVSWSGELARLLASPLRPNGELWYLWALALHLLVVWATRRVALRVLVPTAGVFFVIWGGWGETLMGDGVWHALGPGLQGAPQFLLFTLLGARRGPELVRSIESIGWSRGLALLAAWQATAAATALTAGASTHLHNASGVAQILLGVPATLVIARAITSVGPMRTLRRIGHDSLSVYLTHTLVIVVCLALAGRLGLAEAIRSDPTLSVLASIVAGTVVSLALHRARHALRVGWLFALPASITLDLARRRPVAAPLP